MKMKNHLINDHLNFQRDQLRNPIKNARNWGSAKDGVHHFIVQRVTAVALVFLSLYIVGLLLWLIGSGYDYASVRAAVAHPVNTVLLIAFVISAFWHAKLGLQVVIEDYVHTQWTGMILRLGNIFICVLAAIACVFAIFRIALGA